MQPPLLNNPVISIGMPVYNGEKYIREALDSLLAQTFTDFELIISDNCSTDATAMICQVYVNKDSRIRCIRQNKNIGASANFEFVLNQAKGRYFMWAACDDRWSPHFVDELINALEKDKSYGLAFSNYLIRNLETNEEKRVSVRALDNKNRVFNYLLGILNMCPSLIYGIYRTELIKNTKFEFFDFADVYFISELSLRARIRVLDDYLYIAGTKGERKPYSLTHGKIKRMPFLKKQYQVLSKYFSFPIRDLLFLFTCVFMIYSKIRLWRY